jgi:glycosyltransferase involved in cell wall biosynthesis
MRTAVVLSTYNWPRALELAVWGFAMQSTRDFELVIADDGSGPETAALVERLRDATGLRIRHVWHEDRGFRKSEILNRAIAATDADYLIFSDGDCLPRHDFVATHASLARRGRFLAGSYVKLPARTSDAIQVDDVVHGRALELDWLRRHGYRPGKYALRFTGPRPLLALIDVALRSTPRWRGNNSSAWRDDLLAVNGFDAEMGYGGQDAALGDRLENLGVRPRRVRYRTLVLHLHHERPWRDPAGIQRNREIRRRIRERRETRAVRGIDELAVP